MNLPTILQSGFSQDLEIELSSFSQEMVMRQFLDGSKESKVIIDDSN